MYCRKCNNLDFNNFREVVLGEDVIGKSYDCTTSNSGKKMCAPKRIVRGVAKAFVHEDYEVKGRSIIAT